MWKQLVAVLMRVSFKLHRLILKVKGKRGSVHGFLLQMATG